MEISTTSIRTGDPALASAERRAAADWAKSVADRIQYPIDKIRALKKIAKFELKSGALKEAEATVRRATEVALSTETATAKDAECWREDQAAGEIEVAAMRLKYGIGEKEEIKVLLESAKAHTAPFDEGVYSLHDRDSYLVRIVAVEAFVDLDGAKETLAMIKDPRSQTRAQTIILKAEAPVDPERVVAKLAEIISTNPSDRMICEVAKALASVSEDAAITAAQLIDRDSTRSDLLVEITEILLTVGLERGRAFALRRENEDERDACLKAVVREEVKVDPKAAKKTALKIKDEDVQAKALRRVALEQDDLDEALDTASLLGEGYLQDKLRADILVKRAKVDPDGAESLLDGFRKESYDRERVSKAIMKGRAALDPKGALERALSMKDPQQKTLFLVLIAQSQVADDVEAAEKTLKVLDGVVAELLRDETLSKIDKKGLARLPEVARGRVTAKLAPSDPIAAQAMARSIKKPRLRIHALAETVKPLFDRGLKREAKEMLSEVAEQRESTGAWLPGELESQLSEISMTIFLEDLPEEDAPEEDEDLKDKAYLSSIEAKLKTF